MLHYRSQSVQPATIIIIIITIIIIIINNIIIIIIITIIIIIIIIIIENVTRNAAYSLIHPSTLTIHQYNILGFV